MKTRIITICFFFALLLSTGNIMGEKPAIRMHLTTSQGVRLEFFQKQEPEVAETIVPEAVQSVQDSIRQEKLTRALTKIDLSRFVKPEMEIDEPAIDVTDALDELPKEKQKAR